jgi:hypothetical protein
MKVVADSYTDDDDSPLGPTAAPQVTAHFCAPALYMRVLSGECVQDTGR